MSLLDTSHGGQTTFRKMECTCGSRFESEERIARRLPPAAARTRRQPPAGVEAPPPLPASANPPSSGGGVGGGLPELSGQTGVSDPGPISPANPNRARAKSNRGADLEPFEPEFEIEWSQTAKTGSKRKARRAWRKAGKPAFGASWKRWEVCSEWRQEWFNYPHVATWINDGRCAQDPAETKPKAVGSIPASKPSDPYCGFHHQPRTRGRLPAGGPAYGCPECKHAEAMSGNRSGEPMALGGIR
jgi:hypothetical protein